MYVLQCFGTYDTKEEAVAAHDIAVLLLHGLNAELNLPITEYIDLAANTFHPHIQIPTQVLEALSLWKARRKDAKIPAQVLDTLNAWKACHQRTDGSKDNAGMPAFTMQEVGETLGFVDGFSGAGEVAAGGDSSRAASADPDWPSLAPTGHWARLSDLERCCDSGTMHV